MRLLSTMKSSLSGTRRRLLLGRSRAIMRLSTGAGLACWSSSLAHTINVLRDPEQRVQVAQPAFAVLDVGLDQIARLSGAAMAFFALGKLGSDEFGGRALHDFLVEPGHQLVVERLVPGQKSGLED